MSPRRTVRVTEPFFERLDELLSSERGRYGEPSATDFLLHEIPTVIDRLAMDFEGSTLPVAGRNDVRVLITAGVLVPYVAVYSALIDDVVAVIYLELSGPDD